MPRFYFDVREGPRFIEDREGIEHPDLKAAEHAAVEAAAEISRDLLLKGDTRGVTIEVSNDQRQRLLTIKVTMEVDRMHLSPRPRLN